MNDFSDEQLFELMKNNTSNQDLARLAWKEFFGRYKSYLWKSCLQYCKGLPDSSDVAKDLFQTTMQKIFVNARAFNKEKNSGIKSWISKIAFNEFQDYFKKYHLKFSSEIPEEVPEDETEEEEDTFAGNIQDIRLEKLKQLLSHLSGREYKILITYMSYHQLDNPDSHIPDEVLKELCTEFNLTPSAIRQIKRRAILKLKKIANQLN